MISRLSDRSGDRATTIDPSPLLGEWTNYDDASRNIVRLTLVQRGDAVVLRVIGVSDIDWGETTAHPFALTVAGGEAVAFKATYDFGFLRVAILAYLNKRLLVVDAYSTFHDDSGRSSYFVRDHFYLK
ncbi:MAG TPA: hypothetical protein VF713_13840 [Thermoanaerobaculia bacterium]